MSWRFHKRKYPALDATGSTFYPGRFHRIDDEESGSGGWQALYLGLAPEVCLGEVFRNTPPAVIPGLNFYRLSEVRVDLLVVLDCRDIAKHGISLDTLLHPTDHRISQQIALEARAIGAEAILVPSATRLGDNLVVFPDHLRPGSRLEVISSRDPVLYVERG